MTTVRLRATDGTAEVSIGVAPKLQKALPTDIKPTASAAASSGTATVGISPGGITSRRSSVHSTASSKSRSLLSGEGEKIPIIEGNVQFQGGYECAEKVINVLHTPDGNAVGQFSFF